MWSLPDIQRLNDEAVKRARQDKRKSEKALVKGHGCEVCGKAKAIHATPWYDPFGDDPKGYLYQCQPCWHGDTPEGYFTCSHCGRLMIENYTWEMYYGHTEEGRVCLNCLFDDEVDNPDNWVTSLDQVTWERVRKSKHLIPVQGKYWERKLIFLGNVEFDNMDGHSISGGGLEGLKKIVEMALADKGKCILILDAAYQFAVSIGVYVEK